MNWLQQLLQKLFGTQPANSSKPAGQAGGLKNLLFPSEQIDSRQQFAEISHIVEPFLKGMAEKRWGPGFLYEAQLDALRWSVWVTNTTSFITEYWSVTIEPGSTKAEIRCDSPLQIIRVDLSKDSLEKGLSRAARRGPAIRNIPVENILDENI